MKKFAFILSCLLSSIAIAGGAHFHPKKVATCSGKCNAEQIKAATPAGVQELIKWRKVHAKWNKGKIESVEKKTFTKGEKTLNAWVVALGLANERKFIFFTEDGMVFRSNETGVLK